MKLLVLTSTYDYGYNKEDVNQSVELMTKFWNQYKEEHNISLDVDIEFLKGDDFRIVRSDLFTRTRYYYSQQFLMKKIESLIESDGIFGLVVDPILTYTEEIDYKNDIIEGNTARILYDHYSHKIPFYFYVPSDCYLFNETSLCKRILEDSSKLGYKKRPFINDFYDWQLPYFDMFGYFIDYHSKKQSLNVEIKQEDKPYQKVIK